jgi:hypothetical protein
MFFGVTLAMGLLCLAVAVLTGHWANGVLGVALIAAATFTLDLLAGALIASPLAPLAAVLLCSALWLVWSRRRVG